MQAVKFTIESDTEMKRRIGETGSALIRPLSDSPFRSSSILLRFELGKFFLGASDVGFLSDPELKKLLLSA